MLLHRYELSRGDNMGKTLPRAEDRDVMNEQFRYLIKYPQADIGRYLELRRVLLEPFLNRSEGLANTTPSKPLEPSKLSGDDLNFG